MQIVRRQMISAHHQAARTDREFSIRNFSVDLAYVLFAFSARNCRHPSNSTDKGLALIPRGSSFYYRSEEPLKLDKQLKGTN
jgi:hypothetical protein